MLPKEIIGKKEYISKVLDKHIASYDNKRSFNHNKALRLFLMVTTLGATNTILLGLDIEEYQEHLRISALILSALITLASAYNAFFNNKALWIKYTKASNELKGIRADFIYYLAGKDDAELEIDVLNSIKKRLDETLEDVNNNWELIRKK